MEKEYRAFDAERRMEHFNMGLAFDIHDIGDHLEKMAKASSTVTTYSESFHAINTVHKLIAHAHESYSALANEHSDLVEDYNKLLDEYNELKERYAQGT